MIPPKKEIGKPMIPTEEEIAKRLEGQDRQGTLAEENCRNDILILLLGKDLRYLELIKRLVREYFENENTDRQRENGRLKAENKPLIKLLEKPNRFYSKQTVTNYLRDLYTDGYVTYSSHEVKFGSRKPPYCLTDKGREEAEDRLPLYVIQNITDKELSKFISSYKSLVTSRISSHLFYVLSKSGGINARKALSERKFLRKQITGKVIDSIDEDLLSFGFSKLELTKLWLIDGGDLIKSILRELGAPNFFKYFDFTIQPQEVSPQKKEDLINKFKKALQSPSV
jgi:DNA-binding PadR family transcriptional regulator